MQQGTQWNVSAWCFQCGIDLGRHFRVGMYVRGVQLTQILCSVLREVCADCHGLQDQSEVVQQWCQLIPAPALMYRVSKKTLYQVTCIKMSSPVSPETGFCPVQSSQWIKLWLDCDKLTAYDLLYVLDTLRR